MPAAELPVPEVPRPESHDPARAVVALDDDGVVRSWDAGAEGLFGRPASEAIGRPIAELVIPRWLHDAHAEGFSRFVREGHRLARPSGWTVPAVAADGSTVFVDIELAPIEVEGVHRTVAVIREATADPTSAVPFPVLLEALFARAPEIITIVDTEGRQRNVNDAATRILGYDPAMQVPPSGYSFIHPDDQPLLAEQRRRRVERARAGEDSIRYRVLDAEGNWRWLESLFLDLYDVPGVESLVVFSRDVTDGEQRRVELAEARAEAERQAEQLRQFDEARNDFVVSVSHELRTPLTSLISGAELLLDDDDAPLDAATRDTVEILQRNAYRLRRLVEDLLLVSRLGTGMEEIVPVEIDIQELLQKAVDVARLAADARGVDLVLEVKPGPPVTGDLQQLRAVVGNIVGNAVKYTDPATAVRIDATPHSSGWTIDVRDHGPGLAEGEEERIFQRFARGSAADAAKVPGTGLGLAIARAIVDLHGGMLEPVDVAGRGAQFRIILPWNAPRRLGRPS